MGGKVARVVFIDSLNRTYNYAGVLIGFVLFQVGFTKLFY